ncbi:MAG: PEP-CTERM sorting domain-containing protein, partial [Planctomycetota bacterium]|nr:PEP-CTERM sorting domain-containing protein [Planctomycetota bacterium]
VFVGGETIVNAVVDTTHTADGVHAVKELYTGAGHTGLIGASTSDNGVPGADVAIPSLTTVYVHDHVTVDALGQITGLSNTVTQATPEPSSFVLVGIAAVGGLVYSRRRNKA